MTDTTPAVSPADAITRTVDRITHPNDCSRFELVIVGGSDPVKVYATPDQLRRALLALED